MRHGIILILRILNWRIPFNKELGEMKNKKVWEIINTEDVPEERRTIKCKWVFKIKRNGMF
jgi:hypothetical protein